MQDSSKRLVIPEGVLIRDVGGEAVLLNLKTRQYYSLNSVGIRMVRVMEASESIEQAVNILSDEYNVDPAVLRGDLQVLVKDLLEQGLVEVI